MRILAGVLLVWVIALPYAYGQETDSSTAAENFLNDETVFEEEVEVTFAEEVELGDLPMTPPAPEYDVRPWLTVLPVACALVLAWNVRWKGGRRRHEKRKKRP